MKWRYASFLIRFWQRGTGRQRVTVSHIQSGEKISPESLPGAFAWIADRTTATAGHGDPAAAAAPDGTEQDGAGAAPADPSS